MGDEIRKSGNISLDSYEFPRPRFIIDLPSSVMLIFLMFNTLKLFNVLPKEGTARYLIILGSLSILYTLFKKGIRRQLPVLIYGFFYTFFGILGILLNENVGIKEIFAPLSFIGMCLLILNFNISVKITKSMYYLTMLLLTIKILVAGSVDLVTLSASRNIISEYIIVYFAFYAISKYKKNENITIFSVLLAVFVAILGVGRSGILSLLLLLLFFLVFDIKGKKHKVRNFVKSVPLVAFITMMGIITFIFLNDNIMLAISNFTARGLRSSRINIWMDYMSKTFSSLKYFIFGAPMNSTYWLDRFSGNLHNSFLQLHSKYGLIILIITLLLLFKATTYYLRKRNLLFFSLLIVVVFRMQFDTTNFNGMADIILFYLMFKRYYDKYEYVI